MNARERVLAALQRQPVDRIPYCEMNVDAAVGLRTAALMHDKLPDEATALLADLPALKKETSIRGGAPEQRLHALNKRVALEPMISGLIGRDNITFQSSLIGFDDYALYKLNPNEAHLGMSADGIIKTRDDLDQLKFRDVDALVEDAKEFLKHKGDFAACAEVYLGIDPVWHSMGFETFCIACMEDPDFVDEVMARVCGHYAKVAEALCKLDFDFIWAADDIAYNVAPMFSPAVYRDLLLPHTKKVAEKITKPWVYHSDGNLLPILDDLISQGMNAIHPLEPGSMDLAMLARDYGARIAFVGGVALTILEAGTEAETIANTKEMLDTFMGKASYLLCTCNTVTPDVIPQNLKAMLETLQKYGIISE